MAALFKKQRHTGPQVLCGITVHLIPIHSSGAPQQYRQVQPMDRGGAVFESHVFLILDKPFTYFFLFLPSLLCAAAVITVQFCCLDF